MIDIRSLRIGNVILFDGIQDEVTSINSDPVGKGKAIVSGKKHQMYFEERLDPIPLSSEVLESLGFKNAYSSFHDGRFIYNLKTNPTIHFQYDSDYDAIIVSNADADEGMMFGCKYIHQLQNLIHSLTNKEIEYSPK